MKLLWKEEQRAKEGKDFLTSSCLDDFQVYSSSPDQWKTRQRNMNQDVMLITEKQKSMFWLISWRFLVHSGSTRNLRFCEEKVTSAQSQHVVHVSAQQRKWSNKRLYFTLFFMLLHIKRNISTLKSETCLMKMSFITISTQLCTKTGFIAQKRPVLCCFSLQSAALSQSSEEF